MRRVRLSLAEARRVALAAQGFDQPRPAGRVDIRHFRRVIDTLGLLQLDYVNVLLPAHFLVPWSRLGDYDRNAFEQFVYQRREYTEQWAHEASIVPVDSWALLEYRRQSYKMHKRNPLRKMPGHRAYLDDVLERVRRAGPLSSGDLPPQPGPRRNPGDWHRSLPRWALEYHFARGDLAVTYRLPNFQRVYDLSERVIPAEYLDHDVPTAEAQTELLRRASRALGVATLHDLADYYRMSTTVAAPLVKRLVTHGDLHPIDVEGWKEQAYLAADARIPREIGGASLLSPFDPVVWFRPRAERLFDFHYRIEIYVPAADRRWGYYVLPFRVGDRIVARVDLKADRQAGVLLVRNAHGECGIDERECCVLLGEELDRLRNWLGMGSVSVDPSNQFSQTLARQVH